VRGRILLLVLLISVAAPAGAAEISCTREDFAAVVDEAGDLLRRMTSENTPRFQDELRLLKEQRGWSEEEFLEAARPLVQNERIAAYDDIANGFLANINRLGAGGGGEAPSDCRLLIELRGHLFGLVETMKAKWAYMFARLRAETAVTAED
jgi:hypothetical protein